MAQLKQPDLEGVLALLRGCENYEDLDTLRLVLLRELARVIPYDSAALMEGEPERGMLWTVEPEDLGPLDTPSYERWYTQHPTIAWYRAHENEPGRALHLADFVSQKAWHALDLYREFFAKYDIEDQLTVSWRTADGRPAGIPLNRDRRSFTARDRELLEVLRPHLTQLHRRAHERAKARRAIATLDEAASQGGRAVVLLARDGSAEFVTGRALDWMRDYFPPNGDPADHLPAPIAEWLGSRPPDPLVVEGAEGRLLVRLLPANGNGEQDALLLEERREGLSQAALRELGLTSRESEILRCADRGLTNVQTGLELGISPRTVQKHCERIYGKLGVWSRTAALARVREGVPAEHEAVREREQRC
jgi:DNA-binding NarL/FixJ family response regulator